MRAGPLSNPKVIELLNGYFVPVYTSNDFISGPADSKKEEQKERGRVYGAFLEAKLSAGTVHVYVLSQDAAPLGSLHVAHAVEKDQPTGKDQTQLLLEKTIRDLKTVKGDALVAPRPQSKPPTVQPATDALVLHLMARKISEQGRGSWNEFPAEDWIVLSPDQWKKLLPSGAVHAGDSWDVDNNASTPILTRFFPQTECCTAKDSELLSATGKYKHRLEEQSLRATVVAADSDKVMARLDGHSKVLHQFYPQHPYPPTLSTAKIVGYLVFDPTKPKIESLRLVSEDGKFEKMDMGVAVRSVDSQATTQHDGERAAGSREIVWRLQPSSTYRFPGSEVCADGCPAPPQATRYCSRPGASI
jgi:hypothetical protein